QRQDAHARLARVIDELRKSRGHFTILRGHDLRLREAPRDAVEARPTEKTVKTVFSRCDVADTRLKPGANKRAVSRSVGYVPLRVHSHYSFLDSTLSPRAIVELAKRHGLPAVVLTDAGNLHGAVEFVQAAQAAGLQPILGAELRV